MDKNKKKEVIPNMLNEKGEIVNTKEGQNFLQVVPFLEHGPTSIKICGNSGVGGRGGGGGGGGESVANAPPCFFTFVGNF